MGTVHIVLQKVIISIYKSMIKIIIHIIITKGCRLQDLLLPGSNFHQPWCAGRVWLRAKWGAQHSWHHWRLLSLSLPLHWGLLGPARAPLTATSWLYLGPANILHNLATTSHQADLNISAHMRYERWRGGEGKWVSIIDQGGGREMRGTVDCSNNTKDVAGQYCHLTFSQHLHR